MPLTTEDARALAEAEVRGYCGWHVAPERTEDLVLDGSDASVLVLPSLHVTAVNNITVDGAAVDVSTVEWSGAGFLRRAAVWASRLRGVVVNVTHGYAEWPVEVDAVAERIAARAIELVDASQVFGQVGQVRYAAGVEGLRNVRLVGEAEQWVLDRYRLPPRP